MTIPASGQKIVWNRKFPEIKQAAERGIAKKVVREVGAPVEGSVIRLEQQKLISGQLKAGNSVVITGTHRSGKMSMLFSLQRQLEQEGLAMAVEGIFNMAGLARLIHAKFGIRDITDPIGALAKHGRAVIGLDEFTRLWRDDSLLQYISSSIERHRAISFALVIHSVPLGEEMIKRHFPYLPLHYISPITREETNRLILQILDDDAWLLEPLIDAIHGVSGGMPILIHLVINKLLSAFGASTDENNANERAGDILRKTGDGFLSRADFVPRNMAEDCLYEEDKVIIASLVRRGRIEIQDPLILKRVERLHQLGLVKYDSSTGNCEINGSALLRYYTRLFRQLTK